MQRSVGVEEARIHLGQLADEVAKGDDAVVLTRRGQAVAGLLGPEEYARLIDSRRRLARAELLQKLAEVRSRIAEAGLDVGIVEEAIAAARAEE